MNPWSEESKRAEKRLTDVIYAGYPENQEEDFFERKFAADSAYSSLKSARNHYRVAIGLGVATLGAIFSFPIAAVFAAVGVILAASMASEPERYFQISYKEFLIKEGARQHARAKIEAEKNGSNLPVQRWKELIPGKDNFYENLNVEMIDVYQKWFEKIIGQIDVAGLTRFYTEKLDKETDQAKINQIRIAENGKITRLAAQAQNKDGLWAVYLKVIVDQYILADPLLREQAKSSWVRTVLDREPTDFFPDPWRIRNVLYKS